MKRFVTKTIGVDWVRTGTQRMPLGDNRCPIPIVRVGDQKHPRRSRQRFVRPQKRSRGPVGVY